MLYYLLPTSDREPLTRLLSESRTTSRRIVDLRPPTRLRFRVTE